MTHNTRKSGEPIQHSTSHWRNIQSIFAKKKGFVSKGHQDYSANCVVCNKVFKQSQLNSIRQCPKCAMKASRKFKKQSRTIKRKPRSKPKALKHKLLNKNDTLDRSKKVKRKLKDTSIEKE